MSEERYEPVSCDYHDELEAAAMHGSRVELEFDLEGRPQRGRGKIADVYTADGAEWVRFTMSGTEATMLAMRDARAFTGRELVVRFAGHFHGWHDYAMAGYQPPFDTLTSTGVPKAVAETMLVAYPNNIESEEVLVARARTLHPETPIGDNFESRFRKGQGKAAPATPKAEPAAQVASAAGQEAVQTTVAASHGEVATTAGYGEPEVNFVPLPDVDAWDIPVRCLKCNKTHVEPVRNFMIGNVIFCPHCNKSMVVRDNLNFHIRSLLKDSYDKWERDQNEFAAGRERELAEFVEKRAKEAQTFESRQRQELEKIRQQLGTIGETYDAPGRPLKKGFRFGFG